MATTRNPIKLHDVARIADVSISTVSRALNNDARVNARTRNRIMAVTQVLEGDGKAVRNRVIAPRTDTMIAVVQPQRDVSGGDTEISVYVLESLQDVVEPAGGSAAFVRLKEYRGHSWMDCVRHAEGLIGYRLRDQDAGAFISGAQTADVPFVLLNRTDSAPHVATCCTDHVQAGRQAAMHLLDNGHTRVGLIFNSLSIQSNQQRLQGIRETLQARSVVLDPACIRQAVTAADQAGAALEDLVNQCGVTAVITAHDRLGTTVLSEASRRGLRIPDDVSVVSFDGTEAGALAHPSLTSIYTPWTAMTRMAGQMLLWMMKDQLLSQAKLVWAPRLIKRESVAPPKSGERGRSI